MGACFFVLLWVACAGGLSTPATQKRRREKKYFLPPNGFRRLVESNTTRCRIEWCRHMLSRSLLAAPWCRQRTLGNEKGLTLTPRKVLITGVGRSGTQFVSRIFTKAGMKFLHDIHRRDTNISHMDGAVSWPHAFSDQQFYSAPGRSWRCPRPRWVWASTSVRFSSVVHLVRDPLKTIASRWNRGLVTPFRTLSVCNMAIPDLGYFGKAEVIVAKAGLVLPSLHTLRFTLRHYVLWNLFVEAQSTDRVRVEDLGTGESFHDLCLSFFNPRRCPTPQAFDRAVAASHSKKIHSGHTWTAPYGTVTWSRLEHLDKDAALMASVMSRRYGYKHCGPANNPGEVERCGFLEDEKWTCWLE